MKKIFYLLIFITFSINAQTKKHHYFDFDTFYGHALEHDKSLSTAIQGNPLGFIAGYSIKNTSNKEWAKYYNYPDFGFSALYQNTNSDILGDMYGLYTHYNFYLNNRNSINKFQLRIAFGLGYITKPYNEITNPFNFSLSTKFAGTAYFKLNYHRDFFKGNMGFQTGLTLLHFSNASVEKPNLGLNTIALNFGLNYNLNNENFLFNKKERTPRYGNKEKIKYSLIVRYGINEGKIIDSGQYPFYVGTFQLEKKINFKSTLTTGVDYFKADFLNNYLQLRKELETGVPDSTNYKTDRVGVFVGHELYIHNFSMVSQIGVKVYYPNKYVSRVYERFGFKTQLTKNIFTELTLKLNIFRAEGVELGVGYRF